MNLITVLIITIVAGLFAGLMASLLGLGGGTILVPILYGLFKQFSIPEAQAFPMALGTTMAVVFMTTLGSSLSHWRLGHCVIKMAKQYAPWIMVGAFCASQIAGRVNTEWLADIFPLFLFYVALRTSGIWPEKLKDSFKPLNKYQQAGFAFLFGNLAVMLGMGGGVFLVPHFIKRFHVSMACAVGTTALCAAGASLVGMLGYMLYPVNAWELPGGSIGYVYWPAALIIGVSGLLMASTGAKLAKYLPEERLKQFFSVFLVFIGIGMWFI